MKGKAQVPKYSNWMIVSQMIKNGLAIVFAHPKQISLKYYSLLQLDLKKHGNINEFMT